VVTTQAHASIAQVHERMPGIIGVGDATAWLRGEVEVAVRLLTPHRSQATQA
jgi:putative SOS response-associated peptidase YedK